MMHYMNMNMTIFHGFGMLVFWIIFIYLIFSVFKLNSKPKNETALDILKKRLARGEITIEQFDNLKQSCS